MRRGGFTLVELLTVIALIMAVAALAAPNFAAMLREQRVSSAINSLQTAIMRARTYAVNKERDHSVEFCTEAKGGSYLRIETESAYLESVPNLQEFIRVVDTWIAVPDTWVQCFLARRDAWGASDGYRLYTGIVDVYWFIPNWRPGCAARGWGHFGEYSGEFKGMSRSDVCRLYYDRRYPCAKRELDVLGWQQPAYKGWRSMSVDERFNAAEDEEGRETGYLEVNDNSPWSPNSDPTRINIQDNLAVDDCLWLPFDVSVVLPDSREDDLRSRLINFDAPTNTIGTTTYDVADHGWDATSDLRFGKNSHLIQTHAVEIVLRCGERQGRRQYVRLQMLRGVARLRKME